jgi:hypothetical protein
VLSSLDRSWDDLVRAPSDPDLLVATTVFTNEIGVSHNGGVDWVVESVPDDVVRLAIDPADAGHWVFAGRGALYERLSPDQRWTAAPSPVEELSITAAAHAPTDIREWLVGDAVRGLFRTEDLSNWVDANSGLDGAVGDPPETVQAIVPVWLAYAPGDASVAYASVNRVGRNQNQRGLWRSDSGGASWSPRVAEGAMVDDRRVELTGGTRVFVSPHDPDHVFFAFGATFNGYGTDIFRSGDGLRSVAVSHFDDFYEMFAMAFGPPGTNVIFVGASSDIPSILRHMKLRSTVDLEGKSHVLSIEDAKTPETRQHRIDKAIQMLREGRT